MNTPLARARRLSPLALILTATFLQAATYHVSPAGNDAADGSAGAPFLTIQRGVNAAAPGDTVLVAPGVYATGRQTTVPASGYSRVVIAKNVTVRSTHGAAQTVIEGQADPSAPPQRFGADCVRCVYMSAGTLDGFTLRNGYANANAPGSEMTDPVKNGGGVYAPDNNRAPQVNNCIITGCGAYRGGGAHWATLNNCTVVGNYLNSTSGTGVFSCHVRNSIVQFNGAANDENYASAPNSVDKSVFSYSCTSPAPVPNFFGEPRDGGANIVSNPLFVADTFLLSDTSPCINAGNNAFASGTLDAAGGARVQGGTVDMGAYERGNLFNVLTVINGTGSGSYSNGAQVAIGANATNAWVLFSGWTGDVATVADTFATNTTLTMPASNITVTATYQELSLAEYLSRLLGIPLPVTTGNIGFGDADPAVPAVRLGGVGDNQSAFISTVYTNAGTLLFPWRVSSEAGSDRLTLIIDGTETNAISGLFSGTVTQFVAGAGAHTVRWEYSKDGADYDLSDEGWLGAVTWIPEPLAAELGVPGKPVGFPYGRPGGPLPFPYGFEACFLDPAAPAGAVGGAAVKLGGLDSGGTPFFADSTSNGVEVVLHGAGALSFSWCTSNQLSDPVICSIDGVEAARASGTKNGWLTFTTNLLTAGAHTVRWSYVKSASGFAGADAAWIDNVTWTQYTRTLTVESGSGSGTYAVGDIVAIAADAAAPGQEFAVWDGDTETVSDLSAPATTLTMPNRDITVRALYKVQTHAVTVIGGRDAGAYPNAVHESTGEPEGEYPAGALVRVVADPAPLWQTFDRWVSADGAVFADEFADVSMFTMPASAVTVTATYRLQSDAEKLANALTIRGQPLDVTAFSASGVVAVATGGIRYNDPVVKMGGPSVGPNQDVYLTTTNFAGSGILIFWWHGDTEEDVDGVQLEVNGEVFSDVFSMKDTNAVDNVKVWSCSYARLTGVTNITWRYTRDESYYVHDNVLLLDRVTWIPQEMIDALGAGACVPNINAEYDPLFLGRDRDTADNDFEGEDGGVAWVHDAPGGGDAIRLGRFGYVTNNLCAQVAVTNFGTGVLSWQWTSSSEGVYDTLGFYIDGVKTNWVSGKREGTWYSRGFTVTSALIEERGTPKSIFNFRYQKDNDVSMLADCGWLRNVVWTSTYKLVVNGGTVLSGSLGEPGYYAAGMPVTLLADAPAAGYYFDRWTGTNVSALGSAVTSANPTFPMPPYDLTLTATYTTNAPPVPHYTLTVVNGSGGGSYPGGATVAIEALPPNPWHTFQGWTGDTASVADPSAAATTVQIGTSDLTVTATYAAQPVEELIQLVLGVPAPVTFGNLTAANVSLTPPSVTLGPVGDLETAFFTTVYTNAGTVIFPWSVDSEEGWDFLRFSVDGTNLLSFTGEQQGVATNFIAGDGPHVLRWSYEKDSSGFAGTDSAAIGKITWIPDALAAELGTPGKTLDAPDGFDAVLLDTAPPAGAVGNLAVRLGGAGTVAHGGSVALGTVFSGSGTLSFRWRSSSEQSHDFLILAIDGKEAARISGTKSGWLLFETNLLSVADHKVQWRYAKDDSVSSGSDCGWIDSVTWTQFAYTLTVADGSGSGTYAVGETVTIAADPAPAGQEFDVWDGDIESLLDPAAPVTTLTMPARDIAVSALYRQQTLSVTVINGRDGGAWPNAVHESTGEPEGAYPAGAEVRVIADAAPLWQTFACWTSGDGAVFADTNAPITTFLMPANSVTVTAVYRAQTAAEKLADALTIAGQPLSVTSFSDNGIAVESAGGVRYNDPVVKFGGPSVGAGQSVQLTTTSFTGDGVLLFWWKGNAETAYDEVEVVVNGSTVVGAVSGKGNAWHAMTNVITAATSISLRFKRDGSYFVRDNTITVDRLTWIPRAMINALGCAPCIPDINGESALGGFDGEDGGVAWVNDAPGGTSAIRFGRFGYVNNSQHAQLTVTNSGTGILMWQWAANSEAVADRLDLWLDYGVENPEDGPEAWISGKEASWSTGSVVVKSGEADRETARKTLHTFLFDYSKDADVSVFEDCAWLRGGSWTPTSKLTLTDATNTAYTIPAAFAGIADVIDEAQRNIFPAGTQITLLADPPEAGYYFDSWEGNLAVPSVTNPVITMPAYDVALRATYTTNVPISSTSLATAPQARITGFVLQPSAAAVPQGVQALGLTAAAPMLVLQFEGLPQTDYALEWAPSLTGLEAVWQPLEIAYREVLGDTADGRRQIRLSAALPANAPQGFFRVRAP